MLITTLVARNFFLDNYLYLEQQMMTRNLERVKSTLTDYSGSLEVLSSDWANWDDTYQFVTDKSEKYIESNLPYQSVLDLKLDFMLFFDKKGNLLTARVVDKDGRPCAITPDIQKYIIGNKKLIYKRDKNDITSGIILCDSMPALIVARPILTSKGEGPINGTLVFGYFLDIGRVESLARTTHQAVSLVDLRKPLSQDLIIAKDSLLKGNLFYIHMHSSALISSYIIVRDIDNKPAFIIRIDANRDIYLQGKRSLLYLFISIIGIGVIFVLIILVLMERIVLSKLMYLSSSINQIRNSGSASERLTITGNDELAVLARAVNQMLDSIESSAEKLKGYYNELELKVQERTSQLTLANEIIKADIVKREQMEERLKQINRCFITFGDDPTVNIASLTEACGELLQADCALYNRLNNELLCTKAHWNVPQDYLFVDKPEGHVCYDVIMNPDKSIFIANDLQNSRYYETDINVSKCNLQCYLGKAVRCHDKSIGSLCVVYKKQYDPSEDDKSIIELISSAIGVEEERYLANELLRKLEIAVKQTMDGIVISDINGKVGFINNACAQILGSDIESIIGKYPKDFCSEDEMEHLVHPIGEMTMRNGSYDCEIELKRKGMIYPLRITNTLMKSPEGEVMGTVSIWKDLTSQKKIEAQLALSQKMESIGHLAAGIAHEINTPMQYIGDNTVFLKNTYESMLALIDQYSVLKNKITSQQDITDTVAAIDRLEKDITLDYIRSESPIAFSETLTGIGQVRNIILSMKEFVHPGVTAKSPANLNKAIEITTSISRNCWKYVATLNTELSPDLPSIFCLIDEINQVILNMVINAAHAIEEKIAKKLYEKGNITIKTHKKENMVIITISDDGIGIPKENLNKIFDIFFTTKEVGRGTGQGLALSLNIIVNKHGGVISVESEPLQGTTFFISLPTNVK
ncbi:MAG TPA: hypothetical protein DHV24_11595 [Candidatus Margulisbacteria bacterium]|nr:hypothetical protein [Candidatus Margulisiibacteriota bacterium]